MMNNPSSIYVVPEDGTEVPYVRQDYADQLVASAALDEKAATIDKAFRYLERMGWSDDMLYTFRRAMEDFV